ncbi:MAG: hypothetical protein A2W68_00220 [Betaproteobacteria bacterium RIFCSPLOWO2_02_64_14]|nr:MAG: hypothetical protein A2W68_00220 [Betaproteobacteria bacterium RIFCSPLOWO2_02_64_14]
MKKSLIPAFLLLGLAGPAHAQEYPTRPMRLIVATVPGGGTDAIARILGGKLSALLGQQFVIDNRGGAGGIIGTEIVARAPADGYTLLMGFIASLAMNPALVRTPYDTLKDFSPVSLVADAQYIMTVHPSVPPRTVKDFVSYAKSNPGRINYASAGNGTPVHLAAELFKSVAGVNLVHVPYKGGGPAAAAVLRGEAQLIFGSVTATMPQIKAGKLIALGVTGPKRLPSAPQYATIAELGYPGFEVTSWYGVLAPARTPAGVITKLNAAVINALKAPEVREQMARQGLEPIGSTPAEFAAHLKREVARWARVVKEAGIKAD